MDIKLKTKNVTVDTSLGRVRVDNTTEVLDYSVSALNKGTHFMFNILTSYCVKCGSDKVMSSSGHLHLPAEEGTLFGGWCEDCMRTPTDEVPHTPVEDCQYEGRGCLGEWCSEKHGIAIDIH